jgi:hypothetical protein
MNEKENCKGCAMIVGAHVKFCYMRLHDRSHICSCGSCLVKVMCDDQAMCTKRNVSLENIRRDLSNGYTYEKYLDRL